MLGNLGQELLTDGGKPLCACWELNLGPLQEQQVLLTADPSLQPQEMNKKNCDSIIVYSKLALNS